MTHESSPNPPESPFPKGKGKIQLHPLASAAVVPASAKVDESLISLLEASFKLLAARQQPLAAMFYSRLFAAYPNLRAMFPADLAAQERKLTETLTFVIDTLRRPATLNAKLAELGALHRDKGVRQEHYAIVRDMLVDTMRDVAGKDWTQQLDTEWRRLIDQIGEHMHSPMPQR